MLTRRARTARDYNRGLPSPAAGLHIGVAALCDVWGGTAGRLASWAWGRERRFWATPLLLAPLLFLLLLPFDQVLSDLATSVRLGGDIRRELEAWQQYGALGSLLFTALLVWRLDPARTRRLLDLVAAVALTGLAVAFLKPLIGRVRPGRLVEGADRFVPLWGEHVRLLPDGARESVPAWQAAEQVWSMPSSHTAYAVVLSVFIIALYPRLKWVGIGMVALVGVCRVLFGAHYPSDVAVGVCLAMAVATPAVHRLWGVRALDWLWLRFVDPQAQPAAGRLASVEPGPTPGEAEEEPAAPPPALAGAE